MKVSDDPLHIVVPAVIVMVGTGFPMVIVIELDVPVVGEAHAELEVMIQETTCPFVSVDVVKVGLLVPTLVPPTCH